MGQLCEHVSFEILPPVEDVLPRVIEIHGVATPVFGWDPNLQADTPRLKCSTCAASQRIIGVAVRLKPQMAGHRQERDPNLCGMCGGDSYDLCDSHAAAEDATWG